MPLETIPFNLILEQHSLCPVAYGSPNFIGILINNSYKNVLNGE
ncbi:Uncharacterised protein [Sphingobacterium multivorum]|uniref:Uncharacterized protein n=1 Tax=Sphingobacterium multivorum TaxID=28454 RepID=A0A2X2JLF2_SPHMU|nr:Uncharacterised protein [Sphingobacterium multivorum]